MNKGLDEKELRSRLEKIVEQNPEAVGSFALRCALRALPFIADNGEFRFRAPAKKHALAVWRANYIGLFSTHDEAAYDARAAEANAVYTAARAAAAAAAAAADAADAKIFTSDTARKAVYAAANASDAAANAANADAFAYAVDVSSAAARALFVNETYSDLETLEEGELSITLPLWSSKTLIALDDFYTACQKHGLTEIISDYEKLWAGGKHAEAFFQQPWDKYEALWEKLNSDENTADEENESDDSNETSNSKKHESSSEIINQYIPNTQYLADDTSTDDHLNRQHLVSAVASWLSDRKNNQHIALGLFGEWGAGKSTFIEHLKKGCKKSKSVECIWGEFNAWEYEHTENIQAGIAQEAITALKQDLNFVEQLRLTIEYAKERNPFWYWVFVAFGLFFNVIIYLNLVLSNFFEFDDANNLFEYVFGTTLFLTVASGFKSYHKIYPQALANKVKTYLRLPDFGKHLGTIPVMREQLGSLIKVRLKKSVPVTHSLLKKIRPERGEIKDKRFMFVVDDLDRCSHDGVVKTLEAVRLVMNTPNVVVIIAVDQRIALASLALHYEQLSRHHGADPLTIARDYLGKVVNMPITLDKPDKSEITGYLDYLWAKNKSHPLDSNAVVDLDVLKQRQASEQTQLTNTEVHNESDSGLSKKEDTDVTTAKNPALESDSVEVKFDVHGSSATSVRETIEDLSDAQKATFKYWIGILNFSNPRQIKRLNNAYALIRLCHKDEDHVRRKLFPRMVMMFWLEYLNESHSHNLRCRIIHQLESLEDSTDDIVFKDTIDEQQAKAVWDQVSDYISQDTSKWSNVYRQVKGFVLPAIEQLNGEDLASNTKPEKIKEMA